MSLAYAVNGVATDPSRTLYAARQMGLGGVSIGFSNDANGVFSNPAEIAKLEFPQLTSNARKLLLDETQYIMAGWAVPTAFGTFGVGYAGMGVGGSLPTVLDSITGRVKQNPSLEAGSYSNNVTALSYAREIPLPVKTYIGGNYKFFNQSLSAGASSEAAQGTGLDLGVSVKPNSWLTLGAQMQNVLGGSVKWGSVEDKIGSFIKIGGAVDYPNLRAGLELNSSAQYHAGVEYTPLTNVALRAGLNQEAAGSALTYGLGLTNGGFRFDYAFVNRPGLPGDNPHYFSLSYVGERVFSIVEKFKSRLAHIKLLGPRDRFITGQDSVTLSGEAWAFRKIEQKKIWTVTAISASQEVAELQEKEPLQQTLLNGKKFEPTGSFEARQDLGVGINRIQLVGYASAEPKPSVASAEIRVLRVIPFTDTPFTYWAIEPIALTSTLGLVTGYPDNSFKPDKGITRAELVALLVRSLGVRPEALDAYGTAEIFSDVKADNWAAKFIAHGSELKYVSGYPDKTFRPAKVLSRVEGVTILARYSGLSEEAVTAASPFADLKPDFWGNKFIAPARKAGLLNYLEGKNFGPSADFTRAEACEVLYRVPAIQRKVEQYWQGGSIAAAPPAAPPLTAPLR